MKTFSATLLRLSRAASSAGNHGVSHRVCSAVGYRATHNSTTSIKRAIPPAQTIRGFAAYFVACGLAGVFFYSGSTIYAEVPVQNEEASPKNIRLDEVQKHGRHAERKWVIKGARVYDITDWIPVHPGGEVILRAVGGTIDKYWDIFTIHKKKEVYDTLEEYFIGEIDPQDLVDGAIPTSDIDDPFENDPQRDPRLQQHTERPCNAETPVAQLQTYITPNSTFYVRNHLWVPDTKAESHKLLVELYDGTEQEYTLEDLKKRFKEVTVTATLQCSGNRRKHMTQEARSTSGLQWDIGAISTAEWTGVLLRDVLADVGFPVDDWPDDVKHAQFMGAEAYGASIPIDKAVDRRGDVLIAYEMNGEPLPPDHGYPLRIVVPGIVAARSVKWVNKITLSDEESTSQWQRRDYKCFGPNEGTNPNWDAARAIQETPVQSAITALYDISSHSEKDRRLLQVYGLEEDTVVLEGYCFAGGGREIVRVDISANDGRTWGQAELLHNDHKGHKFWAWKRWRFVMPKREAGRCFVVKAVDESYNTQPGRFEPQYNFRGNLTHSWHRVGYRASQI